MKYFIIHWESCVVNIENNFQEMIMKEINLTDEVQKRQNNLHKSHVETIKRQH